MARDGRVTAKSTFRRGTENQAANGWLFPQAVLERPAQNPGTVDGAT